MVEEAASKDLLVIIGASETRGLMPEYLRQLRMAGIDVHVESIADDVKQLGWKGGVNTLAFQIRRQRELALRFREYEKLVFSDGWDVLFFGSKQDVLHKIPNDRALLAAERNCYPDIKLAATMAGSTPWRFANGGLLCGTPEHLLSWFQALEDDPFYNVHGSRANQSMFNVLLHSNSPLVAIDSRTELFYCAYLEKNELQFDAGLPVNTNCGTRPHFLHFNGQWPCAEILARRVCSGIA